jgi:polyhydroxybutyrate depolymerase
MKTLTQLTAAVLAAAITNCKTADDSNGQLGAQPVTPTTQSQPSSTPAVQPTVGTEERTISAFPDRPYLVYTPATAIGTAGETYPLVVSLHGSGSNSVEQQMNSCRTSDPADATCFDRIADADGVIVVYPNGKQTGKACTYPTAHCDPRAWAPGSACPSRANNNAARQAEDILYLDQVIKEVQAIRSIDADRIYIMGMSNGAAMAADYGCMRSAGIAALALIAGGQGMDRGCVCRNHRRPIIQFHGTTDPRWKYGKIKDTIASYAKYSSCTANPKRLALPDIDKTDQTQVAVNTYENCKDGDLVHYEITGGGHTWPGGLQYALSLFVGEVTRDVDGNRTIWDFFKAHPRPKVAPNPCSPKAGVTGECVLKSECDAKGNDFTSKSGFCPKDPNGVLCCFKG